MLVEFWCEYGKTYQNRKGAELRAGVPLFNTPRELKHARRSDCRIPGPAIYMCRFSLKNEVYNNSCYSCKGAKDTWQCECGCEGKLKAKTAHFRLPSASQKRACLSSQQEARDRAHSPVHK